MIKYPVQYTKPLAAQTVAIAFNPNEINITIVKKILNDDGTDSGNLLVEIILTEINLNGVSTDYNQQYRLLPIPATYIASVFSGQPTDPITMQTIPNKSALNQILAGFELQLV